MLKCGWTHCEYGYITDDQKKVKVGKRWYHEDCARERELINDIVTKFIEQVNDAQIPVLRKVVNDIIYNENKPAEFVMFALDYAIAHPEVKLMYPQGLYRVCGSIDVLNAWKERQNKIFMKQIKPNSFVAEDIKGEESQLHKPKAQSGFGKILGGHVNGTT